MGDDKPTVLVVDDERSLADLYAEWLGDEWNVKVAYDGQQALDEFDADVSVVLLDRRMPGISGEEVLAEIRDRDRDAQVVMITAVEPDFDVVEMAFDDYVVKPVAEDELRSVVDHAMTRATYDAELTEYFAVTSKKALLEAEKAADELADSEEYQALLEEAERLRTDLDRSVAELADDEEFARAFQGLARDEETDG